MRAATWEIKRAYYMQLAQIEMARAVSAPSFSPLLDLPHTEPHRMLNVLNLLNQLDSDSDRDFKMFGLQLIFRIKDVLFLNEKKWKLDFILLLRMRLISDWPDIRLG
jgi:hypothetical protein